MAGVVTFFSGWCPRQPLKKPAAWKMAVSVAVRKMLKKKNRNPLVEARGFFILKVLALVPYRRFEEFGFVGGGV